MEHAFRADYARRYANQRRLAGASLLVIWVVVIVSDWVLLHMLAVAILLPIACARLAGAVGITLPLWLMWGPRSYDERQAVGLLSVMTLSCWFALLALVFLYPISRLGQEIFPGFFVAMFLIFTLFRLRAITAVWLVGICVVTYHVTDILFALHRSTPLGSNWLTEGGMVLLMYLAGLVVCIQFERTARREFLFRQTLRSAKARVESASRVVNQQNERMKELVKEKERFFSAAYHDIQQPLATINLFIRSARMKLAGRHAASHDLDVIEETARDILDMFKDVQDYSELGSYVPHVAPLDTQAVLTEVFKQYLEPAQSRAIELRLSARGKSAPPIESDRGLFKRALSNLVSNAIKNTVSGGVVIGWVRVGERLRIDVWDTGVGIAPQHRNAIFAEYYQINNPGRDKSKGLGLGLSIVNRVMGILPGHSLRFVSDEGRGSRFSLYAPVSATLPAAAVHSRDDDAYASMLVGCYVLLCDDEPAVLEGLRRLFASAGALVDGAGSMMGVEAILAEGDRVPDVVVTDIRLRGGHTGIEIAERVRQHFAWAGVLPVAFITGELLSPHALRDFAAPFVLLRKSSTPESTLAEVSRLAALQASARSGNGHGS